MAEEIHVRQGGTWEQVTEVHTRVGGSWQECDAVYVKTGGVWEVVFSSPVVTLTGGSYSHNVSSGTAKSGVRFGSDGTVDKRTGAAYSQQQSSTDWLIPNFIAPSDYEIREATHLSGTWTAAAAGVGTWVALSSSREWRVEEPTSDSSNIASGTFEIRKGSGSVLDSATYTCTALNLP